MSELFIRKSIEIQAPAERVWRVLTDNAYIPQYMFGCKAETDWTPGATLLWRGVADGKVYVKGKVVTCDGPRRLEYTVIDPNSSIADIPENYLTMIFALSETAGGGTRLEVAQGDFSVVENGEQRYRDTASGDDYVLKGIKDVAEQAGA